MLRAAALVLCALLCAPAGEIPDDVLKLSRIRLKMREAMNTLPNYTCLSVTERSRQSARERTPHRIDTVRVEVAHADHHDLLAWPGAARFETTDPAQIVGSGMFSSGEFVGHLASIFNQNAVLKFAGSGNILGRNVLRWDYYLAPHIASEWRISFAGAGSIMAGAKGSFWADAETLDILRVTAVSDGIPPNFPITEARTTIDYARVLIGDREVLLPQTATTRLSEFTGDRSLNFTEFSHCRQYVTNSEIRYGVDSPKTDAPASEGGVRETVIPGDLRVPLELAADIESRAAVGDPIQALVTSDVIHKKRVVIPQGASIKGRIRQMEPDLEAPGQYILGLEFTDLEYPGYHARFFAKLARAPGRRTRPSDVPGVTIVVLDSEPFRLAKGTSMVWVTEDIARK